MFLFFWNQGPGPRHGRVYPAVLRCVLCVCDLWPLCVKQQRRRGMFFRGGGGGCSPLGVGPLLFQAFVHEEKKRFQIEILDLTARCVDCNWQWCYRWSHLRNLTFDCMFTEGKGRPPKNPWKTCLLVHFAFLDKLSCSEFLCYSCGPVKEVKHVFSDCVIRKCVSSRALGWYFEKFGKLTWESWQALDEKMHRAWSFTSSMLASISKLAKLVLILRCPNLLLAPATCSLYIWLQSSNLTFSNQAHTSIWCQITPAVTILTVRLSD